MKSLVMVTIVAAVLYGPCKKQSAPKIIPIYSVAVGAKTDLYEVLEPNKLKLAAGVKIKVIKGAREEQLGFVLLRPNGGLGEFMSCGCVGATISSCKIENPDTPLASCSGSCTDSEQNPHACSLFGPTPPPTGPFKLNYLARP